MVIVQQLLYYLSSPTSTLVVLDAMNLKWLFALRRISKIFLLLAFLIVSHKQHGINSDMGGCNWLSNMGKVAQSCQFIRSSEDENPLWSGLEQYIISAMYESSFFLSRLLMVFMALSTSLLHTSKDSVGSLLCGWHHTWLQIVCIHGINMGSIVWYNFLKYPCLAKNDFVRDYLRRVPIQFTYFNIPGVIINNK